MPAEKGHAPLASVEPRLAFVHRHFFDNHQVHASKDGVNDFL
ncbi:predicted protein [Plenodomus lingam JN3]|uniref:Predicted protein n=1 Tax=Leptosphaeria maculans (strain JN3 / isolate v23.1.3 / race Av1-4-5-6-7-8) TaxID=985895 RepID=E4ZYF4_LEPMJ|nr:predicted protein [Plenodomus lingam JN3]CBX96480.1 predicted protein [Plenodomus lingam JN3]